LNEEPQDPLCIQADDRPLDALVLNREEWQDGTVPEEREGQFAATVVAVEQDEVELAVQLAEEIKPLRVRTGLSTGIRVASLELGEDLNIWKCTGYEGENEPDEFGVLYIDDEEGLLIAGGDFTWDCRHQNMVRCVSSICGVTSSPCATYDGMTGCWKYYHCLAEISIDGVTVRMGPGQSGQLFDGRYHIQTNSRGFYTRNHDLNCNCDDCDESSRHLILQIFRSR